MSKTDIAHASPRGSPRLHRHLRGCSPGSAPAAPAAPPSLFLSLSLSLPLFHSLTHSLTFTLCFCAPSLPALLSVSSCQQRILFDRHSSSLALLWLFLSPLLSFPSPDSLQPSSLSPLLFSSSPPSFLLLFVPLPSQSEYVADCDKRREYVSGFTGSAGTGTIPRSSSSFSSSFSSFSSRAAPPPAPPLPPPPLPPPARPFHPPPLFPSPPLLRSPHCSLLCARSCGLAGSGLVVDGRAVPLAGRAAAGWCCVE
eukprot:1740698-Rhodomonas_salina.4